MADNDPPDSPVSAFSGYSTTLVAEIYSINQRMEEFYLRGGRAEDLDDQYDENPHGSDEGWVEGSVFAEDIGFPWWKETRFPIEVYNGGWIMELAELEYARIGIEAACYLQRILDEQAHEPLTAALGGCPFGLRKRIEEELDRWTANKMKPIFVFDGQSTVGAESNAIERGRVALRKTQQAWEIYTEGKPEEAVKAFRSSHAVRAQDYFGVLREALDARGMTWTIAPGSACAQLAHLLRMDEPSYVDGLMGSNEILLYQMDDDDAIIYPPSTAEWERGEFYGVRRSDLLQRLKVDLETFQDAMLMTGTTFLPTFPPLQDKRMITRQPPTLLDAINMLRTSQKSVVNCATSHSDIVREKDPLWIEKYMKAKLAIKHCIVQDANGSIRVKNYESLTNNSHEYLGLQLPAELYHYMTQALISPRLMNWFSSLEILEAPTETGATVEEYRQLVSDHLVPLKELTVTILSSPLNRGLQHNAITMRSFDANTEQKLASRDKDTQLAANEKVDGWLVKDAVLSSKEAGSLSPGRLSFAVLCLQNQGFSPKTLPASKPKSERVSLKSKPEILSNVLWRHLHLRGYINDKHELTTWGKALATTLKALQPIISKYDNVHGAEEAALLAFELLRFDKLNARNPNTDLVGGPLRGTEEDKDSCRLIGRVSSLLKLRHEEVGYTGPLSRNLLVFHSMVKAVREADRDLLEAIIASLFLNGKANRDDPVLLTSLGRSLPLGQDINLAMGIGVTTYLDEHVHPGSTVAEREEGKISFKNSYLPRALNFSEDLEVAFKFFGALNEGVQGLLDDVPDADRKVWEDAAAYLEVRR